MTSSDTSTNRCRARELHNKFHSTRVQNEISKGDLGQRDSQLASSSHGGEESIVEAGVRVAEAAVGVDLAEGVQVQVGHHDSWRPPWGQQRRWLEFSSGRAPSSRRASAWFVALSTDSARSTSSATTPVVSAAGHCPGTGASSTSASSRSTSPPRSLAGFPKGCSWERIHPQSAQLAAGVPLAPLVAWKS